MNPVNPSVVALCLVALVMLLAGCPLGAVVE